MLKTPVTKVSEVPTGAVVELGRHEVTVCLKRLHCTGVSYCRFEEELRSKLVFRFDVAHLHDPSSLPVHFAIAVYHWHPCWLVTLTLFRTDDNTTEVAEACGWDWGSRRHCSLRITLQIAWPEAALPWCAVGHGRSVLTAACLAVSRYLATAGLFDGTQLHGTPARRDIPRRPSNLTFVAVPKLKRNTSRRPPSALNVFQATLVENTQPLPILVCDEHALVMNTLASRPAC